MISEAQKRRLFRNLDSFDPEFIEKVIPFLEGLYKYYFRCEYTGEENFPPGRALYVGNHNGMITYEVLMIFYLWWKKFGPTRRALGLAHAVALDNPLFNWVIPKLGAIPAEPEIALEAFDRGYSLLVFPGGEKEAFRTFAERKKVDFFQRKGFIKLALKAKVPIVPFVSVGAHESYIILDRGEEIAEKLGLKKRMRLHGVPVTFRGIFLLWCMVSGLFTVLPLFLVPAVAASLLVPLPTKMTFHLLPAVDVCAMVDPNLSEEENLQKIYDHITNLIQNRVNEEYEKRKFPIIG